MSHRSKDFSTGIKVFLMALLVLIACNSAWAHGINDTDKQKMVDGGYLEYIGLGASHMLTGYDHLLFLFGVIFFLTKIKEIVKFVTAFTVGHMITLIFATFLGISANYFIIDAVIGLTVFYKGFDNVGGFQKYFKMKSPNLVFLVFIFGLIHGFGLSTRLQQLPLGTDGLLLKILSFNLGVEIGQIVALSIMLGVLFAWRKTESFQRFSTASNIGLMFAGVFLFLMQMYGFAFTEPQLADSNGEVAAMQEVQWQDSVEIIVPPKRGVEYKFHILKGEILDYSWSTTNGEKLYFDFHGEPAGAKDDYFESFEERTENEGKGPFEIPFDGVHGWYWKNTSEVPVTVVLNTSGEYTIKGLIQ
jgi:hypothetical protein